MAGSDERTHARLRRYLNGKWDDMDPATRQALTVLADELDGVHAALRKFNRNLMAVGLTLLTGMVTLIVTLIAAL